jgi:hypothetical protein
MDREHEQRALTGVYQRLSQQFPDLDPALVEAAVRVSHHELSGSPIRDFVPLLVEHAARDRLAFALKKPDRADPPRPDPRPTQLMDNGPSSAVLRSSEEVF